MITKQTYRLVRRSIRDNGLRYTAHAAAMAYNLDALEVCDAVANTIKQTDWLQLRVTFARHEAPAIAFKLTTTVNHH